MSKTLTQDVHLLDGHKLYKHITRLYKYKTCREEVFPIYAEISPVDVCNHKCTFCAMDFLRLQDKGNRIHAGVMIDTLAGMAQNGVKSVMFAGEGEPLLHKDIGSIVQTVSKIMSCAVTTNGIYLCAGRLSLIDDCKWIKVSVDAGDMDTYARVHGCKKEEWLLVWKNIREAIKYKKKRNARCTIGVQALLLEENISSLPKLAVLCGEVGVDYLVVKPYSKHSKSINDKTYTYRSPVLDSLQTILNRNCHGRVKVIVRKNTVENAGTYTQCLSVPYFWVYITSKGDVYGCSDKLGDSKFCYGNIYENTFSEIWVGERRNKAMEYMKEYDVRKQCRPFCRMDACNRFLHDVMGKGEHDDFI